MFFELYQQRQQIAAQRDELEAQAEALREAGRRKDEFLVTLTHDITQQKHARAQQDVLLREINHRIKNLFSVTSGLISLSARSATSVEDFAADLSARLQALARAHDLTLPDLTKNGSQDATTTVATLMRAIMAPHEHPDASRVSITGSDAPLAGNALTSLALLLHELTTNAAKYGALSSPHGRLTIDIEAIEEFLHVKWDETGPSLSLEAPVRQGFGTILENAALRGLGGTLSRDWRPVGLSLSLQIPLERLIA